MQAPDQSEIVDCADAAQWEAWLARHHAQSSGVWLRIAKQGVGPASVTYTEALDSALCYGWIDGQRKRYDQTHYLQRYCPRRAKSAWSQRNVERVAALIAAGRMQPAGLREIAAAQADGRWAVAYAPQSTVSTPPDLVAALAQNERAQQTFDRLNKSARYVVMLPILNATTAASRAARVQAAITRLAPGDQD